MSIKTLKTEIKSAGGTYKVECTARGKSIILDEPEELGGSDGGMNPGEALLSAIGGCKYIIAKMFYQRCKINLIKINLEIEGEVDTEALMNEVQGKNENKNLKIGFSKITTKWFIDANNTKEEIEKFVEFVESHCPMKDTIEDKPELKSEIYGKKS
jgi:uncharacterized OsmC-like protein